MRAGLINGLFLILISPWVVWASVRLSYFERRHRLDELARKMSEVQPFWFPWLRSGNRIRGCVWFMGSSLPPFGMGRCMKSSLLMLDLLTRAEIPVTFHLGMLSKDGERAFHAWLESTHLAPEHQSSGYRELWSWAPAQEGAGH